MWAALNFDFVKSSDNFSRWNTNPHRNAFGVWTTSVIQISGARFNDHWCHVVRCLFYISCILHLKLQWKMFSIIFQSIFNFDLFFRYQRMQYWPMWQKRRLQKQRRVLYMSMQIWSHASKWNVCWWRRVLKRSMWL